MKIELINIFDKQTLILKKSDIEFFFYFEVTLFCNLLHYSIIRYNGKYFLETKLSVTTVFFQAISKFFGFVAVWNISIFSVHIF